MRDEENLTLAERAVAGHVTATHVRRCFVRLQAAAVRGDGLVGEDATTQRLPRFDRPTGRWQP